MVPGSIILLHGKLRGMDREAECDILARRVDDSDPRFLHRLFRYFECSILTAPADLPDGDYIAYFAGQSVVATRTRGLWLSSGAAVRDAAAGGLDEGQVTGSPAIRPEPPADLDPDPPPAERSAAADPAQAMELRRGE